MIFHVDSFVLVYVRDRCSEVGFLQQRPVVLNVFESRNSLTRSSVCVCVCVHSHYILLFFVNPVRSAIESVTVHPEQWLPLSMSVLPESVVRFHINGYILFN